MTRDQIIASISTHGLIPCWRTDDTAGIVDATKALGDLGLRTVELTMTMPGALRLIEQAARELPPEIVVGAGTVLDAETARLAILAGARYLVSPCLVPELVPMAHRYGVAVILGAATPTELLAAKSIGADMIKLYPAGPGGPAQVAELISVIPGIRTIVTGGVMLADIPAFITAGADAVVVGFPHLAPEAYAKRRFTDMAQMASRLIALVQEGRDPQAKKRMGESFLARYADLGRRTAVQAAG